MATAPHTVHCIGPSMAPTLRPGQPVAIAPLTGGGDRPGAGEVVLMRGADPDFDVLHRVVCRVPGTGYYVHRGDARGTRAGFVAGGRIVGRAFALPVRHASSLTKLRALAQASLDLVPALRGRAPR